MKSQQMRDTLSSYLKSSVRGEQDDKSRTGKARSVAAGYVVFANWRDFLVGMWGVLEILSDPYGSNFASGSVSVRALLDIDFGVRHPESFAALSEAP